MSWMESGGVALSGSSHSAAAQRGSEGPLFPRPFGFLSPPNIPLRTPSIEFNNVAACINLYTLLDPDQMLLPCLSCIVFFFSQFQRFLGRGLWPPGGPPESVSRTPEN